MEAERKKSISIIVPVYNEVSVLPLFRERMTKVLDALEERYRVKVIFIDDGRRDKSCQYFIKARKSK